SYERVHELGIVAFWRNWSKIQILISRGTRKYKSEDGEGAQKSKHRAKIVV
ncbi:MAG: hypothetical protein ACJAXD_002014, partial [Cryomorphaceae bacterium]